MATRNKTAATRTRERLRKWSAPVDHAVWKGMLVATPAVFCAAAVVATGYATNAGAQETGHGIPPAQSTQRALGYERARTQDILPGFYPSIGVIATRHSNAKRLTPNPGSDTVVTIEPGITYQTSFGSNHTAQVNFRAQSSNFSTFKDESTDSQNLDGEITLRPGERTEIDLYAGYAEGAEARGSSAARAGMNIGLEPDEFEEKRLGVEGRFGRRENAIQLGAGAETRSLEFTNNNQSGRDRDEDAIYGRVYYNVGPRTTLLGEARRAETDYVSPSNTLDSTTDSITVGARWEASDITTLEARVGRTEKNFDSPTREDFDGATYLGRMSWRPTTRTAVSVYASREVEESSDVAASFFVSDLIGVTVNHALSERLSLLGYINSGDDEYSSGRNDDVTDYGVGIDYALREWLSVNARLGKVSRDSNMSDVAFDDTFVTIGVNARRR